MRTPLGFLGAAGALAGVVLLSVLFGGAGTAQAAPPAGLADSQTAYYVFQHALELKDWLEENRYKTVGVLKFKTTAHKTSSFNLGVLNSNLAAMLEDSLAMADRTGRLRLLGNPSRTAFARHPDFRFSRPADLQKLLALEYPLRNGRGAARPDVLLTGHLHLGVNERGRPDPKVATLVVQFLDPARPGVLQDVRVGRNQRPLLIEMPLNRLILSQSGAGFQAPRIVLKNLGTKSLEEQIVADQPVSDPSPPAGSRPIVVVPAGPAEGLGVLEVRVLYGDREGSEWLKTGSLAGAVTLKEPPPADTVVTIEVRNPSEQKVGAVVLVNGVNSIFEERDDGTVDALGLARWVIDPGKTQRVRGFLQRDLGVSKQFIARAPAELANLGDLAPPERLGLITVYEIQSSPEPKATDKVQVGTGNTSVTKDLAAASPAEALTKLREAQATRKKNFIVGGELITTPVTDDKVPNPILVGALQIRYAPAVPAGGN